MDFFTSLPFGLAFLSLFCIVMARANATYWLARGAAAGGRKTKLRKYLDSAPMARAEAIIARWGAPAVALCFLTIGLQTAINLAAGVGRMPYPSRYLPAVITGSVIWALLYATVGLAVIDAAIAAIGGEPTALLILLGAMAVIVVGVLIARKASTARR
ncbi:membrane protein DedA with SNARE-associated domain [Psychromicrobium silvestre]|uniref:Membrane protein DedA with SNARE-associated domain n=1 Tax=Psychromicrobium silvestre TaxID=1645614 RepID=A0A7Y9LRV7_9MICC|nr:VTT domain-containing protein [Psychromicrobium silvestre]NYE94456.1 membrane protein DedA with SNARE-associated domain [Psychromicrobium silvestre]